jgi:hypothetical protein
MVTGMDFSGDGKMAIIRTYLTSHLFVRQENETWDSVLKGQPAVDSVLPVQQQGEAICFDVESQALLLTSEGVGQTLWRIPIIQDNPHRKPARADKQTRKP